MRSVSSYENGRSGVGDGLIYLLIGGGIGAAAALLFAPKSGKELRHDISDIAHKGYDETLELAHQLKEQSNELYRSIKEHGGHVYEFASEKFKYAKEALDETVETAKEGVDGVLQLDDRSQKKASSDTQRQAGRIM